MSEGAISPARGLLVYAIIGAVAGIASVFLFDWVNGRRAAFHGPGIQRDASLYLAMKDATEGFYAQLYRSLPNKGRA